MAAGRRRSARGRSRLDGSHATADPRPRVTGARDSGLVRARGPDHRCLRARLHHPVSGHGGAGADASRRPAHRLGDGTPRPRRPARAGADPLLRQDQLLAVPVALADPDPWRALPAGTAPAEPHPRAGLRAGRLLHPHSDGQLGPGRGAVQARSCSAAPPESDGAGRRGGNGDRGRARRQLRLERAVDSQQPRRPDHRRGQPLRPADGPVDGSVDGHSGARRHRHTGAQRHNPPPRRESHAHPRDDPGPDSLAGRSAAEFLCCHERAAPDPRQRTHGLRTALARQLPGLGVVNCPARLGQMRVRQDERDLHRGPDRRLARVGPLPGHQRNGQGPRLEACRIHEDRLLVRRHSDHRSQPQARIHRMRDLEQQCPGPPGGPPAGSRDRPHEPLDL